MPNPYRTRPCAHDIVLAGTVEVMDAEARFEPLRHF